MRVVLPGVDEVIARPLRPVSMFISDDLPTFDLPIKAYSCRVEAGHLVTSELLISNFAEVIFMISSIIKRKDTNFYVNKNANCANLFVNL